MPLLLLVLNVNECFENHHFISFHRMPRKLIAAAVTDLSSEASACRDEINAKVRLTTHIF